MKWHNHRIVGAGRNLWRSLVSTFLLKQVPQSRLHRKASGGLNISREGDSTTSLGSLSQGSVTLTVKKFFLIQIELPVFYFVHHWAPLRKAWPDPLDFCPSDIYNILENSITSQSFAKAVMLGEEKLKGYVTWCCRKVITSLQFCFPCLFSI